MRVPVAIVACPLVAGAAAGLYLCEAPDRWLPLCAAAGAVLSGLAGLAFFAESSAAAVALSVAIGSGLAGVSLGAGDGRAAYRTSLAAWVAREADSGREEPVLVEGVLRDDAAVTETGALLTIEVSGVCTRPARCAIVRGGARMSVGGAATATQVDQWRAGRRVRLPAFLREPVSYANPGLANDARALARRGVSVVGSVKSAVLVDVVERGSVTDEAAASVRAWARSRLARHVGVWSQRSAAVSAAILVGDRTGLSAADERRLQEAGTYHVIAISGGNIAILTALVLCALHALHAPRRVAAGLAIVVLVFYGDVAGGGASVSRAVIAAVVYLAGRMLDHRGSPLNAVAVAAIAAVAASALAVFDPGFILSFGATLGILLTTHRLLPPWASQARRLGGIRGRASRIAADAIGLFAATLSAELALAPAGSVIFSRVTFAGLALNFVAIPLMTIVQGASMAALAVSAFAPRVSSICGLAAHAAAAGLVDSARLVDLMPWLSRDVVTPAPLLVCGYYAAGLVALAVARWRTPAIAVLAGCVVVMLWSPRFATARALPAPRAGTLRVAFLDVGQGDATLLIFPGGRALLVDAAGANGSFDMGDRVVGPALRACGVRRLDVLAITHGDIDHAGGAATVVRQFRPGSIWEGVPVPPDPVLQELARLASAAGATWRTAQTGDRERIDDVEIRVLNPPLPEWERQRVRNDDSIAIDVRIGDVSIVLPGDIERAAEDAVAARVSAAPLVVLKAPHHGSGTSSTAGLLAAVHPAAVIVSAGKGNRFGHPAPTVVARYRAAGIPILRTDREGAIILETDGHRVDIITWRGRALTLEQVNAAGSKGSIGSRVQEVR